MESINLSLKETIDVMELAISFHNISGVEYRDCISKAIANLDLVKDMMAGTVKFYYQKTDGTIREACGTLKNIPVKADGNRQNRDRSVQVYFDTDMKEWRSFKKINLLKVSYWF